MILVTGGTGYIGSHVTVELARRGHKVIVVDNGVNSFFDSVSAKLRSLFPACIECVRLDIRDTAALRSFLQDREIESVIHLAALKSVKRSYLEWPEYYSTNVSGLDCLLQALSVSGQERVKFVFSSSACVYGDEQKRPCVEIDSLNPKNPYGFTKLIGENLIQSYSKIHPFWKFAVLRYFNPIGCDRSGLFCEQSKSVPENILPSILQSIKGKRPFKVFGANYETPDGTCVRDYVHVSDVAGAHAKALEYLDNTKRNTSCFNVGTGKGLSVLELLSLVESEMGVSVDLEICDRRMGDAPFSVASVDGIRSEMGWMATRCPRQMVADALMELG